MRNRKVIYMVYTLPSLTPFKTFPDILDQIVSLSNKYACGKLNFILLVIRMVILSNLFQQTLYNTNKTSS